MLIDRIPREESVTKGRSHCDSCNHVLAWYDLIPLLSFLLLRGKCRYCKKHIGYQTIFVEIVTGLLFLATYIYLLPLGILPFSFLLSFCYSLIILSCFVVIAGIDAKHGIIPNMFVYPAFILAVLYHLFTFDTFLPYLLSSLGAGFFFFFLFAVTRGRGMGFGDVKLAFLLGMFLGFPAIIMSLYIAFLTGAIVALILVIRRKKKFSKGTIPFGPFLILGALIAFFYGNALWANLFSRFF